MPIHEYLCPDCRTILSCLVRGAVADKRPACPRCGRRNLERQVSLCAVKTAGKSRARGGEAPEARAEPSGAAGPDDIPPEQERRFESLMDEMGRDLDTIDENDPRQIGRFLRKFGEASGEDLGPEFREAVGRLEAGEDPEKVEETLGEAFGEGDDAGGGSPGAYTRDDTLYDM